MEIHLQRGNAVKLLARALFAALQQTPFHLAAFQGGNKHNALPREATARVVVPTDARDAFTAAVEKETAAIQDEIRTVDPDLKIEIAEAPSAGRVWTAAASRKALDLLNALPHGVLAMSNDIPGLVETSLNVATATGTDDALADPDQHPQLRRLRHAGPPSGGLRAIAELAGADVEETEGYSGWKPDPASPLLARFQQVHRAPPRHGRRAAGRPRRPRMRRPGREVPGDGHDLVRTGHPGRAFAG